MIVIRVCDPSALAHPSSEKANVCLCFCLPELTSSFTFVPSRPPLTFSSVPFTFALFLPSDSLNLCVWVLTLVKTIRSLAPGVIESLILCTPALVYVLSSHIRWFCSNILTDLLPKPAAYLLMRTISLNTRWERKVPIRICKGQQLQMDFAFAFAFFSFTRILLWFYKRRTSTWSVFKCKLFGCLSLKSFLHPPLGLWFSVCCMLMQGACSLCVSTQMYKKNGWIQHM